MASVQPIKSKTNPNVIVSYKFKAYLGTDAKGKAQFATKTVKPIEGMTPKKMLNELKRQADTWEQDLKAGIVPQKATTFGAFAKEWFSTRIDNGKSAQNTISYYRNLLPRITEVFGKKDITKIKPMEIEKFLNDLAALKDENGNPALSPATIHHHYRALNAIFGYAELNDIVQRNIMKKVQAPKIPKRALQENEDFLSAEEAKNFLNALKDAPLRWRCMMVLFITTGIRRGEACGLTWEDLDFTTATMTISKNVTYSKNLGVQVGKTKTENSNRTLPLSPHAMALLRSWKMEQTGTITLLPSAFIFSSENDPYSPMFPTSPTKWLDGFTKRNHLPKVSPHDLRHTCGSLMLASGASVKEVQNTLGHSDASTTLNFYVGTDAEALQQASQKLQAVLGL